jgi:hypothetical protein
MTRLSRQSGRSLALLAGFFSLLRRPVSVLSLPSALVFFINSSYVQSGLRRHGFLVL